MCSAVNFFPINLNSNVKMSRYWGVRMVYGLCIEQAVHWGLDERLQRKHNLSFHVTSDNRLLTAAGYHFFYSLRHTLENCVCTLTAVFLRKVTWYFVSCQLMFCAGVRAWRHLGPCWLSPAPAFWSRWTSLACFFLVRCSPIQLFLHRSSL